MVLCIYGGAGHDFQYIFAFLSLKIDFILVKRADPDEMPHNAAFHLALHTLSKCPFRGFLVLKGSLVILGMLKASLTAHLLA